MQPVDHSSIESKLRRGFMPVALSQSATTSIHEMLDELAGEQSSDHAPKPLESSTRKPAIWQAAAAIAGLIGVSAWFLVPSIENTASVFSSSHESTLEEPTHAMHLVDESTRLAWVEDEGWLDDPDGGSLRAVRMQVVEENRILDEQTGIIVHVTSPREEMLFMPVSTF